MGSQGLIDLAAAAPQVAAQLLAACPTRRTPAATLREVEGRLCALAWGEPSTGDAADVPAAVVVAFATQPPARRRLLAALALGAAHEQLLQPTTRHTTGAHFTPVDVAASLVAFALDGLDVDDGFTACDPACGGGVFLVAVAEELHARGWSRGDAVAAVHGTDIDPLGAWTTRAALALWSGPGVHARPAQIRTVDALARAPWRGGRFALVVGNPPFLNQLERTTVRRGRSATAATALGAAGAPYADTAVLFLRRALDLVRVGGRVALIQPQSMLVARDARHVRAALAERGALRGLWYAPERVFAAQVRVCAPIVERLDPQATGDARPVRRRIGRAFAPAAEVAAPTSADSWASLVRDLLGVPEVVVRGDRRVRDEATATAGFRDEYYGLVGAVREAGDPVLATGPSPVGTAPLRLITCGLIDVLGCTWGVDDAKFARVRYRAPVVDESVLQGRVGAWVTAQRVPKVLVATQSKVIEVYVDEHGRYIPSTPVIAVHAPAERLWHLAAALSAPCTSALAFSRVAGAALATHALKLAARQVAELPLPVDDDAWDEGAALARAVQDASPRARDALLERLGETMDRAYGCDDPAVRAWWTARRSPGARARSLASARPPVA